MEAAASANLSDEIRDNSKSNDLEISNDKYNNESRSFPESEEKCDAESDKSIINLSSPFMLDDKFSIVNGCIDFSSNMGNKK